MIEVPFKSEHLFQIEMRHTDLEEFEGECLFKKAKEFKMGLCKTLLNEDGSIAACYGVHINEIINPSIGVPWLVSSKHIEKSPRTLVKYVLLMKRESKKLGIKTFVTPLFKTHSRSERWLTFLGFKFFKPLDNENDLMILE